MVNSFWYLKKQIGGHKIIRFPSIFILKMGVRWVAEESARLVISTNFRFFNLSKVCVRNPQRDLCVVLTSPIKRYGR